MDGSTRRPFTTGSIGLSVAFALTQLSMPSQAGEWPQFLGPKRNGISLETGLITQWPQGGPPEVWREQGGVGMSGLAVSRGMLVTMIQREGSQYVVAIEAKTGKRRWSRKVASEYRNQMGDGPRATPLVVGDSVFTFTGDGVLTSLALLSGDVQWEREVVETLEEIADYGMASSPLQVGSNIVVTAGSKNGTVVAFEQGTGKPVWRAGEDRAGYSSAALLTVGGKRQLVAFAASSAMGLDPDSGQVLWSYPYETDYDCNIATPIEFEGMIFLSSGENHGCVMLKLNPKGGRFTAEPAWSSLGARSVMRNEWQTSILLEGRLFGFDNVGSAGPVTHLTCVDARAGERVWQESRFGKGNLIAADGKLFCSTMDGELVVVRATSKGYDEMGRKKVLGPTRQAPALSDGLLYLRDNREIVCLDVRAQ